MCSVLETPQPYKGAPETIDIFTTRSPIRPNPIALTAVEVFSIGYEAGVTRIAYIDANDGIPVFGTKSCTPSLDRIQGPAIPGWYGNWPPSLEESGGFDWELVFNFQYGSR